MEGSNQAKLREGIVALSDSKIWYLARLEWTIDYIILLESGEASETCLCGHHPIRELCYLFNKKNRNRTLVGNVCVEQFLELGSAAIFDCLKRIVEDDTKALNAATIVYARSHQWISSWEENFCNDTAKKRKLSGKQLAKRVEINRRVLTRVTK